MILIDLPDIPQSMPGNGIAVSKFRFQVIDNDEILSSGKPDSSGDFRVSVESFYCTGRKLVTLEICQHFTTKIITPNRILIGTKPVDQRNIMRLAGNVPMPVLIVCTFRSVTSIDKKVLSKCRKRECGWLDVFMIT